MNLNFNAKTLPEVCKLHYNPGLEFQTLEGRWFTFPRSPWLLIFNDTQVHSYTQLAMLIEGTCTFEWTVTLGTRYAGRGVTHWEHLRSEVAASRAITRWSDLNPEPHHDGLLLSPARSTLAYLSRTLYSQVRVWQYTRRSRPDRMTGLQLRLKSVQNAEGL